MSKLVLLALGDEGLRTAIKYAIQDMNLDIRETSQGLQAVRDVAFLRPNLVIADDMLSYVSGYQLCRLVRSVLQSSIPVILVVSGEKMDQFWGTTCGADYCLTRPVKIESLRTLVLEALKQKPKARTSLLQSPLIGRHSSDLDILKLANDFLDRQLFQEKLLNELRSVSKQVDSVRELVSVVLSVLGSLFSFCTAAVFLSSKSGGEIFAFANEEVGKSRVDSLYSYFVSHLKETEYPEIMPDDIPLTVVGPVSEGQAGREEVIEERDISIFWGEDLSNALCYIAFEGLELDKYGQEEVRMFNLILQEAFEVFEERVIYEQSVPFSLIDTVVRNSGRAFFFKTLSQSMEQALRLQIPLALVILDLANYIQPAESSDKKAQFNFRRSVHESLLHAVRKMDIVARIGPQRFALILLKADDAQAQAVYERVRTSLEVLPAPGQPSNLQGGFCAYDVSLGVDAEGFLARACGHIFPEERK